MRAFIRSRNMCDWEDFDQRQDYVRARLAEPEGERLSPFLLLAEPGVTAAEQRISSEQWMRQRIAAARPERERLDFQFPDRRRSGGPIRLGYLSNDFHDHATALLLIEMLEAHDRAHFETHAFSYGADDGKSMRRRLVQAFDHFTDIGPLSDVQAATAIHDGRIDILIDLKGFTRESRTSILALRPAPVQVNFLGYPGTLGPGLCDYIVTDAFCTPAASAPDFDECFACLPHSYQPRGRRCGLGAAPSRSALGLPEQGFVFCCFNQAYKFTPAVFHLWRRLLSAVPDSVLWLLAAPSAEGNLRNMALAHGVAGSRLIFAPDVSQADHLARLQQADLALDTAPYGAHTTASDALWAGVPIVTLPGATFASRVAGSLLHAVGMPELIARDEDDFFALALSLAQEPATLAHSKAKLANNRLKEPLFDVEAYTRAIETLFATMWRRFQDGLPPVAI
ncbi:UDP-N-acetylglucosamine-peptide N-acetylglucosaminyltransferase [Rhodoblastus acidophilus]|uniref:UDP-N-acetylglucosamine-peptide N-acetylglucosaminyltransferase n=1 Tax=Candidatus Rhodoblastus alkanivorans TaxID=2954117 RepID=A0ABS9Z722_9HYPH|nr:UDP-N-acetylglucosamine-peptide N-acetylglucosaminyltransferase [Candidatus Rhodoblastus alkanivorans]MCI4678587.1 UDP-N-acetylglucosamine-peptide N-acetylglucosaminyltransferase [Candidatus Rhodoblastus alkanivorans]MCI4682997.1 UDP-N-acetylglucosamine-peptide N-acetylglucosaminyltransferase [Candidatus Rhodoblastus alkanivorans]MDI4640307.1 UDP-N-acetylglucosamine-peptide N-acetylglucosaminyltransferase [Rhodoblastus acidophilus]